MKKLEDFNCEKVNISSIYGGQRGDRLRATDSMTISMDPQGGEPDVHTDEDDEWAS
ncbi:hypothetical protein [Flavobacterium sp. '19STA2R22 D10 B1']|uniref:hypothetical protein n=1 Tax=Flavobacterium aerium TaxID=3037261 RepID=UPI00278C6C85|nr:hypothetical protein [Flavobacterium sp. '19STA2R22 D10 B1']